jgi:hypothetical protein
MRRPAALAFAPAKLARGRCTSYVTQGDDDPGTLADDFGAHPLQARAGLGAGRGAGAQIGACTLGRGAKVPGEAWVEGKGRGADGGPLGGPRQEGSLPPCSPPRALEEGPHRPVASSGTLMPQPRSFPSKIRIRGRSCLATGPSSRRFRTGAGAPSLPASTLRSATPVSQPRGAGRGAGHMPHAEQRPSVCVTPWVGARSTRTPCPRPAALPQRTPPLHPPTATRPPPQDCDTSTACPSGAVCVRIVAWADFGLCEQSEAADQRAAQAARWQPGGSPAPAHRRAPAPPRRLPCPACRVPSNEPCHTTRQPAAPRALLPGHPSHPGFAPRMTQPPPRLLALPPPPAARRTRHHRASPPLPPFRSVRLGVRPGRQAGRRAAPGALPLRAGRVKR